jgi:hypothetical protein
VYLEPLHRTPIDGWLDSVVIATLITLSDVIWSAMGRWLLRRLGRPSISANSRMYMNAVFFVLIVVAIGLSWLPLYPAAGRILIPSHSAPRRNDRTPDRGAPRSLNARTALRELIHRIELDDRVTIVHSGTE